MAHAAIQIHGTRGDKERGSKLLRCGAQTPIGRLRGQGEDPRPASALVPAKAATWCLAPQRRNLFPRFLASFFAASLLLTLAPLHAEQNLVRSPGTTRYGAMVRELNSFVRYDQSHAQRMKLTAFGASVQGRTLWLVTLGSGPKRLFYLCRQHGHEPASTEGALAFIRECVKAGDDAPLAGEMKAVTVYLVPMANPDGSEAFLRHNARNVDINRDWIKRTQPETRAIYALVSRLHPDLMTDQHELYPNDTRPDFTEVVGVGSGAVPQVIAAALAAQAAVSTDMAAEGFPVVSHVITDTHPARLAHRFFSIHLAIPTVLFETNRLTGTHRTVAERAAAQEAFMKAVLHYAAGGHNTQPVGPPAPVTPSEGAE